MWTNFTTNEEAILKKSNGFFVLHTNCVFINIVTLYQINNNIHVHYIKTFRNKEFIKSMSVSFL